MTISLNQKQLASCDEWAADDRLWTTQETVAFNLKTFARVILRDAEINVRILRTALNGDFPDVPPPNDEACPLCGSPLSYCPQGCYCSNKNDKNCKYAY